MPAPVKILRKRTDAINCRGFYHTSLSSYRFKPIPHVRSLEAIEKRSRRLLNKGKGAKILDKKQDSGAIVKLVEELRQAILLYQVRNVGNCRSSRADAYWTAVPTTIYK